MKVEVEFPSEYMSDKPGVIPLGRLYIGTHVVRIFLSPDGMQRIAISKAAIEAGAVIVTDYKEG